jgi:hypothetical protein
VCITSRQLVAGDVPEKMYGIGEATVHREFAKTWKIIALSDNH